MKAWLRAQPQVAELYRRYVVSHGPGSWLFNQTTVAWLYRRELTTDLPTHLRLFAAYCRAQRALNVTGHIVGGPWMFQRLSRLGRRLRARDSVRVQLDQYLIYLDGHDPRLLQVPNELLPGAEHAEVIGHFLRPGDTFVDIGANHGSLSVMAAHRVGRSGRVVAIEAQPRLASLVERSLRDNAQASFEVHGCAVGERPGRANFFVPRDTSGSAGLHAAFSGTRAHQTLDVEIKTLDSLCDWRQLPGATLAKLDVEGNELSVLRGARAFVAERKPKILLEVNDLSMTAAGVSRSALVEELVGLGFSAYVTTRDVATRRELPQLLSEPARNVVILR
jgi:FkbM family methyltransferase